ncbi:MAG: T9SS type A sorting domain-containing protein, partial [Bacteroidota bacterium]
FQDSVAIEVTEAEGLTWIEDFSGWPNGTTVDNGPTAWEAHQDGRSKSGGLFGVRDEALLVNSTNTKDSKFVTWASEVIDISGYGTVNVSLDLQSEGVMEDRGQWIDYVKCYLVLDGQAPGVIAEYFGNVNGNQEITIERGNLSGNTLQLLIEARTTSTAETYYIDNVSIESDVSVASRTTKEFGQPRAMKGPVQHVYPNPTTGIVHLPPEVDTVDLISLQGKSFHFRSVKGNVNLSTLPAGIYLLIYEFQGLQVRSRIVKR